MPWGCKLREKKFSFSIGHFLGYLWAKTKLQVWNIILQAHIRWARRHQKAGKHNSQKKTFKKWRVLNSNIDLGIYLVCWRNQQHSVVHKWKKPSIFLNKKTPNFSRCCEQVSVIKIWKSGLYSQKAENLSLWAHGWWPQQ